MRNPKTPAFRVIARVLLQAGCGKSRNHRSRREERHATAIEAAGIRDTPKQRRLPQPHRRHGKEEGPTAMRTEAFSVSIQRHDPEGVYAAGFQRGGQPWILDGALVGIGATPVQAAGDLARIARHLVIHGENFLTPSPLSLADREWLYSVLGGPRDTEMREALQAAREGTASPRDTGRPARRLPRARL